MRKALATLLRVRAVEKRVAKQRFAEAELARRDQEGRVFGIHDAMDQSREAESIGVEMGHAHWISHQHAWRLRLEVDLRRERGILERRAVEASRKRAMLREADRASRVVELALERHDDEVAINEKRAVGRVLDELATTRWWRENGG